MHMIEIVYLFCGYKEIDLTIRYYTVHLFHFVEMMWSIISFIHFLLKEIFWDKNYIIFALGIMEELPMYGHELRCIRQIFNICT